jgi:exosortase
LKAALATPEPLVVPNERGMIRAALVVATFGFLWFVLCRLLSGEWSVNEQYNYGWFVPFFCAYLFWLRWESRPAGREQTSEVTDQTSEVRPRAAIAVAVAALLLLLPLRVFELGNPDWRPLGWIHALIVVTLTLLALGWIGGGAWVRHFAFPVAFILVAVPWISPIEQPVVQGLMRTIAAAATEALTLCGIPAQLEGNLIRISSGVVGVNEACSGVRALQTALMIGLLFGELKRFSLGRRAVLVVVAIALSIFANFLRTFLLVLIAAQEGIAAVDRWHDVAGYSIVALVFLGTMAAAALLSRSPASAKATAGKQKSEVTGERSEVRSLVARHPSPVTVFRPFYLALIVVWLVFIEIAAAGWYRAHERDLVARTRWSVRWPSSQESFRDLKIEESVRQTLRFDEGRAGRWIVDLSGSSENGAAISAQEAPLRCTLFFFRWNAGGGTVLRARAHRPEICLPSTGWEQTADHGARSYPVQSGVSLPFRHLEFVHKGRRPFEADQFAHTFFCLQQDWMEPKNSFGPRTALVASDSGDWGVRARVRAVEQGLRDLGQQTMEVVFIAAQPLNAGAAEAKFGELLPQLIKVEQPKTAHQ